MSNIDADSFEDAVEDIQNQIEAAQAAGNSSKANRLYLKQRQLYLAQEGAADPAVGEGGVTA